MQAGEVVFLDEITLESLATCVCCPQNDDEHHSGAGGRGDNASCLALVEMDEGFQMTALAAPIP